MIAFTVFGIASGMGSKKAFIAGGRAHVTDTNKNLATWKGLVAEAASRAIAERPDWQILGGGVRLSIAFYLPRPKSLKASITAHTKKPDCSKLIRSTEDALTGVCYRDDAQVVELVCGKYYTGPTAPPHVRVRIEPTSGIAGVIVPPAPLPLFADVDEVRS